MNNNEREGRNTEEADEGTMHDNGREKRQIISAETSPHELSMHNVQVVPE